MGKINGGEWDDQIEDALGKAIAEAIDDFGPDFDEEGQPLEEGESDRIRDEEHRGADSQHQDSGEDEGSEDAQDQTAEQNPVGGV
jgi:F-type H+-transporting ATPase subunit alpha